MIPEGLFDYDLWTSRAGASWGPGAERGDNPYDNIDFHVDLGCGTRPKGRIGIDRHPATGVAIVADLDDMRIFGLPPEANREGWEIDAGLGLVLHHHHRGIGHNPLRYPSWHGAQFYDVGHRTLPFANSSVQSIVSHHFFEHCGPGFIRLVDECYRVLKPGGILRAITPLFPSTPAVEDPDHKRYFMARTWDTFCGDPSAPHWHASFSVPYTSARFKIVDRIMTPRVEPELHWTDHDAREIRVALQAVK